MEKKARTLTPRENIMRILNRQTPEWIPFTNDEVWYLHIDEVLERGPEKGGAGIRLVRRALDLHQRGRRLHADAGTCPGHGRYHLVAGTGEVP